VLIDADGNIVAGHGRVEAARLLGYASVPTIRLDHLTEGQLRAYVIADNRLAELAGWDREILAIELQALIELDLDFDVEITGFQTAEIDLLIEGQEASGAPDPADQLPDIGESAPTVSRPGDLWVLGDHRLLCADALMSESLETLMGGATARMVFTDPPYNVAIDGHVCGLGRIKHREFAMASGEMTETEFTIFLETVLRNMARHCVDGAILDVCMDWRHLFELLSAGRRTELSLMNLCVWNKTNGGMGSFYRSKHELVCVFKKGSASHLNNIDLGRYGRYRTNVWDYAGINTFKNGRIEELAIHPTVKPVALVADAIKDCTRRGDIVLDGFVGSGTTLMAAEKTGRIGYGIELDPGYVDVAVRRWQRLTGEKAIHIETAATFDEVARISAAETAALTDPATGRPGETR
jgi:DNA modification methylase